VNAAARGLVALARKSTTGADATSRKDIKQGIGEQLKFTFYEIQPINKSYD
jgi:hypothetical protein